MKGKKFFMLAIAVSMVFAIASCGKSGDNEATEVVKATLSSTYPIETDQTIRWWQSSPVKENDKFAEFLEEATGIKVEWEFPADSGNASTAFNLMIASDNLPDVIQSGWANSHGGPDYNLDKKIITDLTPYMDAGIMPNLKAYIDEHPELKKMMTSSTGRYYYFPQILGDERLASFRTWFVREDLLEKANLEKPETLDEWEQVLYAFKDMGIETPLMAKFTGWQFKDDSPFLACFDTPGDFYHDGNTVKYGFYEDGFGEWVKLMAKWYSDGILDKDFLNETNEHWSAEIINGKNGAFFGSIGGDFGTYTDAINPQTGIRYTPCKVPSSKKGEKAMWSSKDFMVKAVGCAVSYTSKNKELAVRLLDYGYSKQGQILWNFGKEGVSYEMKKNEEGREIPTYTDVIMDPAKRNGLTQGEAMGLYTRAGMPISVQSIDYLFQNYKYQAQKDAIEVACGSRKDEYALPLGICNAEQEKKLADIITPIDTYREETISKIIAGKLPIETLEEYYKQLKALGVEEAISIYQEAYNKYLEKNNL
jgi:putative aldouronate transport system substrate-binding protein